MATRRTEIVIDVQGLSQLQAVNTALRAHDKIVQQLTATYLAFNAATGKLGPTLTNITNNFNTFNNTTNATTNNITNMGRAMQGANALGGSLLGTMLRYRAVGAVFQGIETAVHGVVTAMFEMEKQAARVQRVSAPGSSPLIRATITEEVARTGADAKDVGEAYYQLNTQLKNTDDQFKALQATMNLVVGTEVDSREAARGMLQIYNQFPDAFDKSVSPGERLARISNLLALTWKDSSAELSDVLGSLKYLAPVAEATGDSLANVLAIVSGGTIKGQRGRMLGTGFSQVLLTLAKKYQTDLPGGPGIQDKEGNVYHFKMVFHEDGKSIDSLKTLMNMVAAVNSEAAKSPEIARKMQLAIFGNIQGFRAGATQSIKDIQNMEAAARRNTEETKRTTDASNQLRKTMDTTAQDFQKVWGGAITFISNLVDTTGLRTVFSSWANDLKRAANFMRQMQGAVATANQQSLNDLTTGPLRIQVASTLDAVERAQQNLRTVPRDFPLFANTHSALDIATKDMTPAERDMIRRRYMHQGPFGPLDEQQMAVDRAIMTTQLRDPRFGLPPRSNQPANPLGPGFNTRPGLDANGKPIVTAGDKDAGKAAEEAEKAAQEALDREARRLQTEFENTKNRFGEFDARTLRAGTLADAAAAKAGDADQRLRLKYGLTGNVAELAKGQEKRTEEQIEKAKDDYKALRDSMEKSARTDYDLALKQYGLFSGPNGGATGAAAAAAQRAEEAAAIASGDTDRLRRLRGGLEGTGAEFAQKRQGVLERQIPSFGDASIPWDKILDAVARNLGQSTQRRLAGIQRGARPNDIFSDQTAAEGGRLQSSVDVIQSAVDKLAKMTQTSAIADELQQMRDRLADANAALVDFKDRVTADNYQKRVQSEADAYQLRDQEINHLHRLKFNKDEDSAVADGVRKYQELVVSAQKHLEDVKNDGGGVSERHSEAIRRAAKDVAEAQQNATDFRTDALIQKYQNVYRSQKSNIHGAFMDFFHGQGDIGTVAQRVGGSIVDAALESQIKRWSDPLVQTTTQQILEIQGNTAALKAATDAINGGGGAGGGGGSSSGGGGSSTKRGGLSDLQKGLTAGLAAYSIGATSAAQGVNAGNLLGGILSGASIGATFGPGGGLIGGAVGGIVDLIGGLFHKKSKPTATPQDLNPAFYNAPAAFDVAAYNYSAYGKMPTMQNIGFDVKAQNVPIVNVYVDGAKVAAQQVINSQGSSLNVNLGNTVRDRYIPI